MTKTTGIYHQNAAVPPSPLIPMQNLKFYASPFEVLNVTNDWIALCDKVGASLSKKQKKFFKKYVAPQIVYDPASVREMNDLMSLNFESEEAAKRMQSQCKATHSR